jgi:hypothetical protein
VQLAVIILLIVIFVGVCSRGGRSRGGLRAVPVAFQNEAEITDIKRYPNDDPTGRDQECISLVQTPTPPLAGTLLSRTRRRATRSARP